MAKARNQHVIPLGDQWAVKREGNERNTSIHRTQQDAIDAAREIAKKEGSDLIVHRTDGRIRNRDSYGADPFPPRSPRRVLFPPNHAVTSESRIQKAVKEVLDEPLKSQTKALHVVPYSGNWAVKTEESRRPTSVHGTQSEAIDAARHIAKRRKSDIFIYRPDGSIRDKDSYGRDPHPTRDKKH